MKKFIVPGIVLTIGFARLFQGMAHEKPVTYLVFEIGLFSLVALMIAAQYSYTYLVQKKSKAIWVKQNSDGYSSNIFNNFTILGVAAITGFAEYSVLRKVFESEAPPERSSSSGDWGGTSGCSSGGDSGWWRWGRMRWRMWRMWWRRLAIIATANPVFAEQWELIQILVGAVFNCNKLIG